MKHRKCWSKSVGERGAKVRLYEDRPGGPLFRSVYVNGKEVRKSLGHRDKELAIRQAYELLHSLLANEQALDHETLTIGMLAQLYLESPQHLSKKPRTQRADQRCLERVIAFLGSTRDVATLSESDVRRYTLARRKGDPTLKGVTPGRPVRDRAVELDLVMLMTALNWATRERTTAGRRLLRENPLTGVRLPKEKNPERPVMSHDVYLNLLRVAPRVHPLLPLALIVAEGTGRRISAWRNLVWDDVGFESGTIHWRAEHDKKGFEGVMPMSSSVQAALLAQRKAQAAIGGAPVFPSPKDPTKPCSRHLFDAWLRRAHRLAKIVPQRRGMWHPIRRKWATERKGYPVKDVAAAGGWKTEEVLMTSYQLADAETIKNVVLHPTNRIVSR
jgi:integrase